MDTLTLILPPEVQRRLKNQAEQAGQSPETWVQKLLTRQLRSAPVARADAETEREKLTRLLRKAGMLSEIGPRMRRLVETTPVDHDNVVAILARAGGKPLSEIVLEQRGPKG